MSSLTPRKRICVVGAGVIGLSTAVRAIETLKNVDIILISKDFTPKTTGDVSAGFWMPYLCGDVEPALLERWLQDSFDFFLDLSQRQCAGESGVGLVSGFSDLGLSEDVMEIPGAKQLLGVRAMNETELKLFPHFKKGVFFTSIYSQVNRFLPYLMKRFKASGGQVKVLEIRSFSDLARDYDLIVNCTGLASYYLVPDKSLVPIRGQIIRVKAPWIKHMVNCGDFHALPNSDHVQLGGTKQENNWSTAVDPKDTKYILQGCCDLIPSLKTAEVLDIQAGLRPARDRGPRVEVDAVRHGDTRSLIPVIHNYGHGGSGVTLSWGCAGTAVELIRKSLENSTSKL